MEMICLNCDHKFDYFKWDRTVVCPECRSHITCSLESYKQRIGYEAELIELRKKWNY